MLSRVSRRSLPRFTPPTRSLHSTSAARAEIQLEVDGVPVSIEQGSSLIQACEKAGATVPRFCYHDRLNIAGNCRMCLVEVTPGPPKPQASCAMPAMPGQKVKTSTPTVHKAREGVMEFLLANHPLDCPVCDQGGECDLQDQSMRYGSDRSRFHEITGKRATEDKNFGPLIKTVMTRCIHCTRCVRFANEVAGVQDLGTSGRGNDMQIGTYIEKTINSEMSGNIIDLCPVGALTSKPQAFEYRPWELKHTESIDVLDAVGSNIRVDSRGLLVMRIQPRLNDHINEEWISDKTRFAVDGLKAQRLTTPLVREGDRFVPATWPEAFKAIKAGLAKTGANGNEIQAIAGHLADSESLVALKDLTNALGSDNTTLDSPLGEYAPAHGVDFRSNYSFNSTIAGAEEADRIVLIGTNPRHEAAILNARLRKIYLHNGVDVAVVGQQFDSTFGYDHLGDDLNAVKSLFSADSKWAKQLKSAKKPMIIVGSAVAEHESGAAVLAEVAKFVEANKAKFVTEEWVGYNVLQRAASRTAAYDVGFVPSADASKTTAKFVYLLNADDFSPKQIPREAFVVYQGHHGDLGAQYADVCLPGSAYTEKSTTWVNTEGRTQLGRAAVPPPGQAREDWKIVRALSEVLGKRLPYDDTSALRDRMWDVSPTLVRYDVVERPSSVLAGLKALQVEAANVGKVKRKGGRTGKFVKPIDNFYRTDPVSRSSVTMGKCTEAFA
ncbi:NADH-ubiquinone oxidoreductase 78 kDa subunit [Microbotryum lychnidis-dioicae p1A1 Lamole]|uniref:NADH-ubiquinone oxidoreductase 78 kDa subunit, mitochondrial n=1 Tax=Microbotryum lychnidis-dioicae (strain p1A1 Lamole / MvSl-1064) TaxID=683840 RepID=U5H9N8_USTV1|nr:NADH-ubiquinone oxidoreductase 78 kDa subunit [Microbotryum lychnidis-dioicae p1A1 Lamole]|eukprot:KDE05693.1 NADH-ubiquinone oxidoreductase 78 kDa subunit [Microbotryum lychnidis-dioicae p1A1 Lamole]